MILIIFGTISGIALLSGLAVLLLTSLRPQRFDPSPVRGAISRVLPDPREPEARAGQPATHSDSPYGLRLYDWTVEYNAPIGAQRITIGQDPDSFGEAAAVETARTTAMLHRGTTIEVWATNRTSGERSLVDAVRMESRRAA